MTIVGPIATAELSLSERIRSVRDLLVAKAVIATERVFCGHQFLNLEGDTPRIVFVPVKSAPSTAPLEMSRREGGHDVWECDAHVWARNVDDDYGFGQFEALEALLLQIKGSLRIVAGGRFAMSEITISDTTHVLKYGESAAFSFSFTTSFQMVPDTEPLQVGDTTQTAVVRIS